jgi:hypothetical protein
METPLVAEMMKGRKSTKIANEAKATKKEASDVYGHKCRATLLLNGI